ncbi:mechanosensitive ion channel [Mesorhizobium sp. BR1-1-16]|uniref:mechanosensitive ion channel family protein n=1 Tax=Mesorhizobium sp. BR1-1-16 TaxID=2876653 RepID=UPI001CCD3B3F|nr:mechanosensitive ion channel family protein [Mesorhizobium sp. BR1-1-16]MBZ9937182.1 mechanosensitive ion channel [Mesorhizobium sp. BR1-1-16]
MAGLSCVRLFCRVLILWVLVLSGTPAAWAEAVPTGAIDESFPLRAADTTSPRDALTTFLRDFRNSAEAWRAGKSRDVIDRALARARDTIDFSDVPALGYGAATLIDMALLSEVLDRVALPPLADIPGDADLKTGSDDELTRWVIPNTRLEIVKITDGPRAGEYLFSKESVADLRSYYSLVKDIPYQPGALAGIYEDVLSSPGDWVPERFRDTLPAWALSVAAGRAIWQWIALAVLMAIALPLVPLIIRAGMHWDARRRSASPWLRFGTPVALILVVALAGLFQNLAEKVIGLLELPMEIISFMVLAVQAVGLAWLVFVVSNRLADAIGGIKYGADGQSHLDAAMTRMLFRLISLGIMILLAAFAASRIGIPVAPLVAGLGAGGLAIALAVRPTLENIIGGLTLFADRPVRVGDFCRYGDDVGTVEQIGLRSTRIRTLEQSLVTVPNSEFSQMHLDNFTARPTRLLQTLLHIRHGTTPDQMRLLLTEIRNLLDANPLVTPDSSYVRFVGYGAFSKDIEVFAYLRCEDERAFLATREELLLNIEEIVQRADAGFAVRTGTP